jgi:hypothetical protein
VGTLRAKTVSLVAVIVLILLGGWYLYGPSGGVNLASLTEANFAAFTTQFDNAANDERIVVLVSPT